MKWDLTKLLRGRRKTAQRRWERPLLEGLEDRTLLSFDTGFGASFPLAISSGSYNQDRILVRFKTESATAAQALALAADPGTELGNAFGLVPGLFQVEV